MSGTYLLPHKQRSFTMTAVHHWIFLALLGAAGVLCRAGVAKLTGFVTGDGFPWSVTIVNVVGSFAFAAIVASTPIRGLPSGSETLLLVGFLGGFTTFSSFSFDTLQLLRGGQTSTAFAFMAINNVGGLAAAWAGLTAFTSRSG